MKSFSDGICYNFNPEFADVYFTLKFYGDTSTRRGSTKNWANLAKLSRKFGNTYIFPINMLDCIGATFAYLHGASLTLGPFWVRKLKIFLERFSRRDFLGEPSRAWIESV